MRESIIILLIIIFGIGIPCALLSSGIAHIYAALSVIAIIIIGMVFLLPSIRKEIDNNEHK